MIDDLKVIKKYYGEKMSHLCRELFPTLLEEPGYLSKLLMEKFEPSRLLYEDIIANGLKEQFKNFIYSQKEQVDLNIKVTKTPKELLSEVGYDLYECKTEEEIQSFYKYYAPGEALCTFDGGRLNRCHVFFAVKKDVDKIVRKDFKAPKRQDLYGTSVISIQFTKGESNTVSIKNRYNHTVENPDATFSNNLDNIVLGLTDSFEETYGFNLSHNRSGFEIPGYVNAKGKYYKYNYEFDNIYYCPNNLIIEHFEPNREFQQMERYILFDYFIIDLKEKTISLYKDKIRDPDLPGYRIHRIAEEPFIKSIGPISDIKLTKNKITGNKTIYIYTKYKEPIEIEINKANQMIRYKDNHVKKLPTKFLYQNRYLEKLEANNVTKVEGYVLYANRNLQELSLANVYEIKEKFLYYNNAIRKVIMPKFFFINDGFLGWDQVWDKQPIGIKNGFVKYLNQSSWNQGPFVLFHALSKAIMRQVIKLSNRLINKQEFDYEDNNIKITSIKKSSDLTALINYIISKDKVKEIEEPEKGMKL